MEVFPKKPRDFAKGVSGVYTTWIDNESVQKKFNEVSIVALLLFKGKIDIDTLRTRMREKSLPSAARMRSIAVRDKNNKVYFKELPLEDLDLEHHVAEIPSPTPWTQADIDKYLSECWCVFNDPKRPLWSMKVIQNLQDGNSALIFAADHALGDGISMVSMMLRFVDEMPDADPTTPATPMPRKLKVGWWPRLKAIVWGTYIALVGPHLPADPPNQLKLNDIFNPSPECRFAVAEKVPLDKVKAIKNQLAGCSVNDVLFAVLHLAVRRYLREKKDPIVDTNGRIRANFPINVRSAKETAEGKFGNWWSTGMLELPMQVASREEAVWRMKQQVDVIKLSPSPLIERFLIRLLIAVIPADKLINFALQLMCKFSLLMSNVPGPQTKIKLCGVELEDMRYWLFSPVGLYCGMLSYAGSVSLTLASDPQAISEPKELARCWNEEMEALYKEATKGPKREGPPASLKPGLFCAENILGAVFVAIAGVMVSWFWG